MLRHKAAPRPRSLTTALVAALVVLAATVLASQRAEAIVVERVVAVVGDRAILLSELRERALPFLVQIAERVPAGAERAAAESQMYKDLIDKMIEEELIERAGEKAKLVVTPAEIDRAFETIAQQQNMTVSDLFRQAKRQSGVSEQDYREEVRRQLLEGKLLQLRVKGRLRITEEELRSAFAKAKKNEMYYREFRAAWIILRLEPNGSPEDFNRRWAEASDIVRRARGGEAFDKLATELSDDAGTRDKGGFLGVRAPARSPQAMSGKRQVLAPQLEELVLGLDHGQTADPIRLGQNIIILHLIDRGPSRYTTYDAAKGEMLQRVQSEKLQKAKEGWVASLRKKTFVDVRL